MILTGTGTVDSTASQTAVPQILDSYGSADTAYSLRKLRTVYAGFAIRVRRSTDNTEQDIGFSKNILDISSLLAFCGGGNGFVTVWYDQSGNANHITQTSATSQPQIVASGVILTVGGRPTVLFDGTNDYMTIGSQRFSNSVMTSFYVTQNLSPYNYGGIITSKQAGVDNAPALDWDGGTGKLETIWANPNSVLQTNRQNALFIGNSYYSGSGIQAWTNNVSDGTNSQTVTIAPNASTTWFGTYRTEEAVNSARMYLSEFFNYFSDQSSNRTTINSNLNSFYVAY